MLARATKGDTVRVHYTGRLKDGTVFDSTWLNPSAPFGGATLSERQAAGEPLRFTLGAGDVIPGFDHAVQGMRVGERKTVEIPPEEAYGEYIEEFVRVVPRSQLQVDFDLYAGMVLQLHTESDRVIPIMVTEVTETTVTLDANHPLAGQTLFFDIELVAIDQTAS